MWRLIRISILLAILLFVALESYFTRTRSVSWSRNLQVTVYPIDGDGSAAAASFLAKGESYAGVEKFFSDEAREYRLALQRPFEFTVMPPMREKPPLPPEGAGPLSVIAWSLRMRYWAWRAPSPPRWSDIKLFVVYYDPASHPRLSDSLGVRNGLYGVVNSFADERMRGSNHVVLAHELLHTLGATDKYDPRSNQPLYPIGVAEPDRKPLYPQRFAEIMAGRIPVTQHEAVTPQSLAQVIVGPATARELRWVK
jgi:hypothetical protein